MYTKILISAVLSFLLAIPSFTQQKSKKELRAERGLEKQKQIEEMINAKEFVFVARTAIPQGGRPIDFTTHTNYVKFHSDLIESYMPYYGRAYTSVGYGNDTGLKFEEKPDKFTVTKEKKNYQVNVEAKGISDYFNLSLSVGFEGNATLIISSNNRSSISYIGDISAPEKPK
jgi:hypothetical protein